MDELEYKASEVLRKGEQGFEKWLKGMSVEKLEEIVTQPEGGDSENTSLKDYLKWVKEHEALKVCSSCRWAHGCETCSYEHALRTGWFSLATTGHPCGLGLLPLLLLRF